MPKLSFDYSKDFQPVFLASLVPNILVVTPSVEAKTVADVIALAKAAPDGLDFASSGNGTVQHLSLEMFRHVTGTKINHIPVSRRRTGAERRDRRTGEVLLLQRLGVHRPGAVGQGARHRAYRQGPARHAARPAAGRRHHPGVRGL